MLNFFKQRRAWDDLIMVCLKCGCSGAGLTISAAMAMTVLAWRVLGRNPAAESADRISTPNNTIKDLPPCGYPPQSTSARNATSPQIAASLD